MENLRYALIDTKTQKVKNVIVWDGVSEYPIKKNETLVLSEGLYVQEGFIYDLNENKFKEE